MPYPTDHPKRGEIYWVDFDPARGSEQAGVRPALIVSLNSFNRAMPIVSVAAMTRQIKNFSKIAVVLPAGKPMKDAGQVLAFQVTTIDKSRLQNYVGSLTVDQIAEVEAALRLCWGL